jgi:hypothetical protein
VRRALQLYVASALVVGLALFVATGVKVYADWGDEPKAMTTGPPPVSQEEETPEEEWGWEDEVDPVTAAVRRQRGQAPEPPPPEPNPPKPTVQEGHESCLWYRGRIKWCLTVPWGEEWYITPKPKRRYVLQDLTHGEIVGYLRATSYGWLAINKVCFKGPRPCAWARGGRVVLASGNARVLRIYSFKGRFLGVARGPHAIGVAAFKLVKGDCTIFDDSQPVAVWEPCRRGVGQ